MTHPCPSSIKPSGARCALPDRSMVVTMASRIIGTLDPLKPDSERLMPSLVDHERDAQSRIPMEMIFQAILMILFQAKQQWSRMSKSSSVNARLRQLKASAQPARPPRHVTTTKKVSSK